MRQTIVNQVPNYARMMEAHEDASNTICEIDRTLSTNPKASGDTAMRKLLSTLGNNGNTKLGRRGELAELIANTGAPHLMQHLAGPTLQSYLPRGLRGAVSAVGEAAPAVATGAKGAGLAILKALPSLGTTSPRLMGEAAYCAGQCHALSRLGCVTLCHG